MTLFMTVNNNDTIYDSENNVCNLTRASRKYVHVQYHCYGAFRNLEYIQCMYNTELTLSRHYTCTLVPLINSLQTNLFVSHQKTHSCKYIRQPFANGSKTGLRFLQQIATSRTLMVALKLGVWRRKSGSYPAVF